MIKLDIQISNQQFIYNISKENNPVFNKNLFNLDFHFKENATIADDILIFLTES